VAVCVGDANAVEHSWQIVEQAGLSRIGENGGWLWANGEGSVPVAELVAGIASACGAPVVGAWVLFSDYGAIAGSDGSGQSTFLLPINDPPYEEDVELTVEERTLRELWRSPTALREATDRLGRWSTTCAPTALTSKEIMALLPAGHPLDERVTEDYADAVSELPPNGWPLAEDGLRDIFGALGFPDLDITVFPTVSDNDPLHLQVLAVDLPTLGKLSGRLFPKFRNEVAVVNHGGPDGEGSYADLPDDEPLHKPEWVTEVVTELQAWLAENDINSIRVVLCGNTIRPWTVAPPA